MANVNLVEPRNAIKYDSRALWIIFCVALSLRLALFVFSQPWHPSWPERLLHSGDPFEYVTLARSLVERQEFSITWPVPIPNGVRTPGYPLFLVAIGGSNLGALWLPIVIQILIDSAFCVVLALVVGRCFASPPIGVLAGCLYSIYPEAIFWSSQLFPEPLGVWLSVLGVGLISYFGESLGWRHFSAWALGLSGAFLIGLLVLVKPNWLFLPFIAALWIIVRAATRRVSFVMTLISLILLFSPTIYWLGWNKQHWGSWSMSYGQVMFKQSIAGSMIQRNNLDTVPASANWSREMELHKLSPAMDQPFFMPKRFMEISSWSSGALANDKRITDAQTLEIIRGNLLSYAKLHASGIVYLLTSPGSNFVARAIDPKFTQQESAPNFAQTGKSIGELISSRLLRADVPIFWIAWTILLSAFLLVLYLFSAYALWGLRAPPWKWSSFGDAWLMLVLFSVLSVVLIGAGGTSRYRFSLVICLVPYASWTIHYILGRWVSRRSPKRC